MKRANKEHMADVMATYLKRRNYSTDNLLASKQVIQSVAATVLKLAADSDTSTTGTINCGYVSDPSSTELQFTRLVTFVREAAPLHRQTLMTILFPLFITIYMDMLISGLRQAATRFHLKHRAIFVNLPVYRTTLELITSVLTKCDQDTSLSLTKMLQSELGDNKYAVTLSEESLHYLTNYLMGKDNTMILHMINQHISIHVAPDQVTDSLTEYMTTPPHNKVIHNEASLISLKSAITQMRSTAPSSPSVLVHSTGQYHASIICGHVSEDHVAVGCSDSSILVCQRRGGDGLRALPSRVNISRVSMAGSALDDILDCEALNRRFDVCQSVTLKGHSSDVYDIKSFSDSSHLLSCSGDKSIRLWDLSSFTNRVIYSGHTQTIWALDAAKRSSYFASASRDRSARLWSTDRTFPLRMFVGHTLSVDCVRFHPNNNYMATGSQDKTVRLWSVLDGKCVRLLQGHKSNVLALAFSPDGKYLASTGDDRKIKVWDLATGGIVSEFKGHADTVHCLEYSEEGSVLCSGSQDGNVVAWDIHSPSVDRSETRISREGLASYSLNDHAVPLSMQAQTNNIMEVVAAPCS